MRTVSAGAISILILASPASAQSPPLWTGFYVGVNGGLGGGAFEFDEYRSSPIGAPFPSFDRRTGGFPGFGFSTGGQFGYLHRFDNQAVFGLETDMQWSNVRGASNAVTNAPGARSAERTSVTFDWFGTTRLRSGYAIGRLLPYGTIGVAYGGVAVGSDGVDVDGRGLIRATQGSAGGARVGWTAGAGVEYALTRNLSFKTEYLYTQFGGVGGGASASFPSAGAWGAGSFSASRADFHLVRAGLNYMLGVGGDLASASFAMSGVDPHDWSGFYVGANGGHGGAVADYRQQKFAKALPVDLVSETRASARATGAVAGAQAGYNHQFANGFVAGVETDMQWSDIRWSQMRGVAELSQPPAAPAVDPVTGARGSVPWFGTTRARLGFSFDRVMPFVTGGVAYGGVDAQAYSSRVAASASGTLIDLYRASASGVKAGWTAGGGLEYAVTDQLSFKTQYDYIEFAGLSGAGGGVVTSAAVVGGAPATELPRIDTLSPARLGLHMLRAGVNWRFVPSM